jgi:glycosyltransferase involved in cell wall biosynthesis
MERACHDGRILVCPAWPGDQGMTENSPRVSVIVPVFNGRPFLAKCLDAIHRSSFREFEVIVVNDASTDESATIARTRGAHVVSLPVQSGPGAARNHGVRAARAPIVFFVDADVVIHPDAMARVVASLETQPDVAAVFGSYDDSPAATNFVSQYKNLYHHFTHQQGGEDAATFWAGCGAVRREVFIRSGGFDSIRYPRPSIEDIELGYRLRRMGYRIVLDKQLQGKHLKNWTLSSMLRADVLYRAIPWSQLILTSGGIVNDLNLKRSERVCAALVVIATTLLPLVPYFRGAALAAFASMGVVVALNHKLYRFWLRRRGLWFACRALPLHCLYYLYSAMVFASCWCIDLVSGHRESTIRACR